jgi:hypothetical protein
MSPNEAVIRICYRMSPAHDRAPRRQVDGVRVLPQGFRRVVWFSPADLSEIDDFTTVRRSRPG